MEDLGLVKTLRGGHFSQHEAASFLNAFDARRPLTWCMRMLARRVSLCVEARTPASRERYGHLVLLSSVSAWPFQQGARCAGFHTLLRISRLKFLKHVFCKCSDHHFMPNKTTAPGGNCSRTTGTVADTSMQIPDPQIPKPARPLSPAQRRGEHSVGHCRW